RTALLQRELVQGATLAALESRPVVEDARAVDRAGLPLAVLVAGDDAVLVALLVVLPQFRRQLRGELLHPLPVGLVGEVRAERAATLTDLVAVDALAPPAEDAGVVRAEVGEVAPEHLLGVVGVDELDPFAREVKTYLWHRSTIRRRRRWTASGCGAARSA